MNASSTDVVQPKTSMRNYKKWTAEEDAVLIKHYAEMSNEEVAAILTGRNSTSVRCRLRKLGLTRNPNFVLKEIVFPEIPSTVAAYLAGHFDGEGYIALESDQSFFRPTVTVTNNYLPVLETYAAYFGGRFYPVKRCINKRLYRWDLVGHVRCLHFANSLLPYSMEKREQLEVIKEYLTKRLDKTVAMSRVEINLLANNCSQKIRLLKK